MIITDVKAREKCGNLLVGIVVGGWRRERVCCACSRLPKPFQAMQPCSHAAMQPCSLEPLPASRLTTLKD